MFLLVAHSVKSFIVKQPATISVALALLYFASLYWRWARREFHALKFFFAKRNLWHVDDLRRLFLDHFSRFLFANQNLQNEASAWSLLWDPSRAVAVPYLLGLLAMIKCSICSYQCDN